jgi:hypothetical protein
MFRNWLNQTVKTERKKAPQLKEDEDDVAETNWVLLRRAKRESCGDRDLGTRPWTMHKEIFARKIKPASKTAVRVRVAAVIGIRGKEGESELHRLTKLEWKRFFNGGRQCAKRTCRKRIWKTNC